MQLEMNFLSFLATSQLFFELRSQLQLSFIHSTCSAFKDGMTEVSFAEVV